MIQLRPYQLDMKSQVAEAFRSYKRVMLQLPTGGGKTIILTDIANDYVARQKTVWILVHRKELIDQTIDKLRKYNLYVSVIQADYQFSYFSPVQVVSVQTAIRRLDRQFKEPDLIICDEAHHSTANSYTAIFERFPNARLLGVTATPVRANGEGFKHIFDTLVTGSTVKQLIDGGYLVRPKIYANPLHFDLKSVKVTAGDYNEKALYEAISESSTYGDYVKSWQDKAAGKRTVTFAINVEHSQNIVEMYKRAGIPAEHVDGTTEKSARNAILRRLATGETLVVSNVGIVTEGFDCLDEETEVLTSAGWKGIDAIQEINDCFSLNLTSNRIELTEATWKGIRALRENEKMVTFKSQHCDIRVTEGHKFHVRRTKRGRKGLSDYQTFTALELANNACAEFYLPLSAEAEFTGCKLSDDEIQFIGWALTDSYISHNNIEIYQSPIKYHETIRALLNRLEYKYSERFRSADSIKTGFKNGTGCYGFRVPKRNYAHIQEYIDKSIPCCFDNLTRDQFKVLWDTLLQGNGSNYKLNKSGWLWMPDKEQAERLSHMAVIRGFAVSYKEETTKYGKKVYRISCRDRNYLAIQPKDPRATKITTEEPSVNERVWCLRNENSTLITKRNGKVAIIGNCPAIECVQLARPTKSLALYLQMVGRGLRPASDKGQALVLDHADCVFNHGFPEQDRIWTLDGVKKPKRPKKVMAYDRKTDRTYERHELPDHIRDVELIEVDFDEVRMAEMDKLCTIAKRNHYKPGWVWHKFIEKFNRPTVYEIQRMQKLAGYNPKWIDYQLRDYGYTTTNI